MIHPNGERPIDLLVLTETFPNKRSVEQLCPVAGFNCFRWDGKVSDASSGGDILMYVNVEQTWKWLSG